MPNGACDAVISDFNILKIIAITLIVLWYNENQGKSPKRLVLFKMKRVSVKRQWKKSALYQCNSVNSNCLGKMQILNTGLKQSVRLPQNDDNEVQTVPGISEVSVIMENKST